MSKKYYEHEDRYGKKFYSENPVDPERKDVFYRGSSFFERIFVTALATAALIICPFILGFLDTLFDNGFSWDSLFGYLIMLAIIYVFFGWELGGCIFAGVFQEHEDAAPIAMIIAYILSLIVIFILPSNDPPFLKWYHYVMSGVFAYVLTTRL
mgnify:CR=1 FL=1